jgi:hypothetical protein
MAENIIDKFSYNGNTYKLQDNVSGYVTVSGAASAAPVQSVNTKTGAVVLSASDVGALATTGGEVTGNVTMKGAAASNSPAIIFQRGTLTDNYNDWQIQDRGGYLYFDERGQGSSTFTNRVMFNTTGGIVATTFSGQLSGTISSSTTATTQSAGDNSTKVATTAYVDRAIPDEISDLPNDMVYDLGTITPDSSTGVFSITETQISEISTMWDKGFCAIRATVGNTTYWALKENIITYNNINFMGFAGTWGEVSIGIFTGKVVIGISVDSSIGIFGKISDVLLDDVQGLIMTTSINNKQLMPNSNIDLTASDVGALPDSTVIPSPSDANPLRDNVASPGFSSDYSRADHTHPTDTSRQETLVSGTNIKTINNESLLGSGNISIASNTTTWYGTSNTAAATAAKVVTCADFTLQKGAIVGVLFTTANTAATPTLNVNSTGAKTIYVGTSTLNATTNVLKWSANTMLYFMYDGTYYRYITSAAAASVQQPRGAGTWYGTSSTAAGTAAKTSTIANYVLTPGAVVAITFTTANTIYTGLTLNINGTGAKNIYIKNAAVGTTNQLAWDAGDTLTFIYSGSYYYFLGKNEGSVVNGVQINGTSITSSGVANIVTNTAYNASTNKIATMNDLPVLTFTPSGNNLIISQQQVSGIINGNAISY